MNHSLIDLHMHSTASDGTDHVQQLLKNIRATDIRVFSLTDHDTIRGAVEMESIVPNDMTFVKGVEFSCITNAGKCHILGYGYDTNSDAIQKVLGMGREKRRNKLLKRLDFMKEQFSIEIPKEEREKLLSSESVGKPHLGNLLVSMGLAENKNEAIEKYIEPCRTESNRLDAGVVIRAITESGGISVWAHPYGGTGEKELTSEEFEQQLSVLQEAGLRGLECYYSKYNMDRVNTLVAMAKQRNLLISGGSDYHGTNKKVKLGELNADGIVIADSEMTLLDALSFRGGM